MKLTGGYAESIQRTKDFASKQWREAKGEQPRVTCECGASMPLRFLYRCLFCKMYLCLDCAEIHFGKTVEQYKKDKELEFRRENNIFEVGDSVVLINGDTDLVHYLSGWYIEGLDFRYTTKTNNRGLWGVIVKSNMPNFWRHATPEEITAGNRL